ncbi:MAG: hypothetical protein JWO37_999 [Acidimicrobiales bacterium]|nr:hypothetical protein [Acidimicrobiales bacterium]
MNTSAVLSEDGLSRLDAALAETLTYLGRVELVVDMLEVGFGIEDVVRTVAMTPPFNSVLTEQVQRHLRSIRS